MSEYLNVHPNTVRSYADKGLIGREQLGGKGHAVRYYLLEERKEENDGTEDRDTDPVLRVNTCGQ